MPRQQQQVSLCSTFCQIFNEFFSLKLFVSTRNEEATAASSCLNVATGLIPNINSTVNEEEKKLALRVEQCAFFSLTPIACSKLTVREYRKVHRACQKSNPLEKI